MIPVFDAHCDTPVSIWKKQQSLHSNSGAVSIERSEKCNGHLQFFSFCTPWIDDNEPCPILFEKAYSYLMRQIEIYSEKAILCTSAEDAKFALQSSKMGIFLSVEGAEALDCDPDRLDDAYKKGVRMVNPVWNFENSLCGSVTTGGGFTSRGKAFVEKAQSLGIVIDVSHMSDRAFFELCQFTKKPIVASHSNARAICGHPRNLTDEMFLALCQLGGVCGINLYSDFLNRNCRAGIDDVYRHIDHFMELGGDGHVCLGADFDGCDLLASGFTGVDDYAILFEYLQLRGYSEETLRKLFYESLERTITL